MGGKVNAWVLPLRLSDLIGVEWGMGMCTFKTSPGDSNIPIKLRTATLGTGIPDPGPSSALTSCVTSDISYGCTLALLSLKRHQEASHCH